MSAELGEKIGSGLHTGINKTIYFLVGVCFIGSLSGLYLFCRGIKNGWKKAGKIKPPNPKI